MTKLIINADDFGYSRGINLGIIDSMKRGIVTSTTLMMNMPGTKDAVNLMKCNPDLKVGLHLNISLNKPLTKGKTLTDRFGNFIKPSKLPRNYEYDFQELLNEIESQYRLFISMTGKKPTHIDSHLFTSDIIPEMTKAAKQLAEKYKLPLRNKETKFYPRIKLITHRTFFCQAGLKYIFKFIKDITKYKYAEIMTHPGYVDYRILKYSSYSIPRVKELEILISDEIKNLLKEHKIELISFDSVPNK